MEKELLLSPHKNENNLFYSFIQTEPQDSVTSGTSSFPCLSCQLNEVMRRETMFRAWASLSNQQVVLHLLFSLVLCEGLCCNTTRLHGCMLVSGNGLLYESRIQNKFLVSTVFVSFSNSLNICKYMSLLVSSLCSKGALLCSCPVCDTVNINNNPVHCSYVASSLKLPLAVVVIILHMYNYVIFI